MPETHNQSSRKEHHDYSESDRRAAAHQQQLAGYLSRLDAEKVTMDNRFPISEKLIDAEIQSVQSTGRISSKEFFADIYRQKPIKVSQKVYVPTNEFPKFNFVGKILGPGANSLRRLQDETRCKISILGRNSMRDRNKEEELRASSDPKYAHLNLHLHVEVTAFAPAAEAYANVAYALAELRKYLIPDKFDDIRQDQLRELMDGPDGDRHRAKMEANSKKYETIPPHHSPSHYSPPARHGHHHHGHSRELEIEPAAYSSSGHYSGYDEHHHLSNHHNRELRAQ